ncbi:MAG: PAS domain S-box protein [Gammaproteobacteria bacterium]|nr:PAS domain S-box protein [Gammaproteobacteria bacterium]
MRRSTAVYAAAALPAAHAHPGIAVTALVVLVGICGVSIWFLLERLRRANAARGAGDAQLRASEERLRRIFETMTEGLVVQDRDGAIIDANPAAIDILGVGRERLFGRTSHDPHWQAIHANGTPFPGEEHPAMVTLRTGRAQRHQIMGLRSAERGVRWISINSTPIVDDRQATPAAVISTFFDVTELRSSYERIRELAQRLEVVRAEERRDVALSLHEGIAQDLFAAKLGVANLLHRIDRDPEHARAGEEVLRAVDQCMEDLRQIANELHPVAIAHQSLAQILSRHADEFGRASGLQIDVAELTPLPRLEEPVRLILFRAAQEVLTNVARHASARSVRIVLRADAGTVSVEISDDGVGIHDAALEKPGSLGLVAIRERLGVLRGGFSIRRGESSGTTATLYVPHEEPRG